MAGLRSPQVIWEDVLAVSGGELGGTKWNLHLSLTTSRLGDLGCLQKDLVPSAMERHTRLAEESVQLKEET